MRPNISEELCEKAEELLGQGHDGISIVGHLTGIIDNMLFTSHQLVTKDLPSLPLALVAVGGYGRRELAPYSDVDIMLLAKKRGPLVSEAAETVLYAFWDLGLNISHAFRTLDECVEDAMADLRTRTSLIESRFLAGSRALFDEYKRDIYQKLLYKGKKEFVAEKLREMDKRHKTYGESVYLLEPNVKEGRGGLRDIHSSLWLGRVVSRINDIGGLRNILSDREHRYLVKAYDYFLRIRLCLHILSKRKNDVLSFEYQDPVAGVLGLKNTTRFLAAEIMMRLYYKKARNVSDALSHVANHAGRQYVPPFFDFSIKRITDHFYLSKNEIVVKDKSAFRDSDRIIEAFYLFSETGKKLSRQVSEAIRSRFIFINKRTRSSGKAIRFFLQILGGNRVYETLREMHDTGILDRFIPEFGRLRNLVIYEPYHRYTVDEHTLTAIRNLERLKESKQVKLDYLRDILKSVRQEVLFLAVLLHDTGKGFSTISGRRRGGYHEEAGYKLIKSVVERFNPGSDAGRLIEFLVKNHVLLSKIVLARDADAPETITQLAEAVENERNLNALYLMTYADMSAVNPEFWTEWKAYLFHDIYSRTIDHLRGFRERVLNIPDKELKAFIEDMPNRYLILHQINEMRVDYEMVREAKDSKLSVAIREAEDGSAEFAVVTGDKPGLFSKIVGVMGYWGMNILRARLYTGKSGVVVDKILLSNWKELWWKGIDMQIKEDLRKAIVEGQGSSGPGFEDSSGEALSSLEPSTPRTPEPFSMFKSFVEIDNETSREYTIMELFSTDRLGLLYDISVRLNAYNIDIISAIINTENRLAQDVFYLQREGAKLGPEAVLEILGSIYSVIA